MRTEFIRDLAVRGSPALALICLLSLPAGAADLRVAEGTNLSIDVSPVDGGVAMDLLGSLWQVPARGGDAERLTDGLLPVRRPRYAPDGSEILYQTDSPAGPQLWRYRLQDGSSKRLSRANDIDQYGDWHPGGKRIVFAAERGDTGLDLWETDLATGLQWRLSGAAGDESAPAWSANGRHLSYVLHDNGRWHLMLRRFGHPAESLLESDTPLYAPSWRPDGTLITYLREVDGALELQMLILSDPPLARTLASGEDFFISPVSWRNRQRLYYAADGTIRTRTIDERQSTRLPFSAAVLQPDARPAATGPRRELPAVETPGAELVVRAARLYDGHEPRYCREVDVIVKDGRIAAIEEQRDRGDTFVLDLGDITVMPGLIDLYSPMPEGKPAQSGPRMLAFGVTTMVTPDLADDFDAAVWASEDTPGPRLLHATAVEEKPASRIDPRLRLAIVADDGAAGDGVVAQVRRWQSRGVPILAQNFRVGLRVGADLFLGAAVLPASPQGRRYQDVRLLGGNAPMTFVSGLADAATPGSAALRESRQAKALPSAPVAARRFAEARPFGQGQASLVLGSRPSGLPAGYSSQAELLALQAAGLSPAEALHAATGAAAAMLGLPEELGRLSRGARADLLLIAGDPLANVGDAQNIVAVVQNGRFYSLSSLLERADVD